MSTSFLPEVFGELLANISQNKQHIVLIDGQGTIIASSDSKDLSGFVQGINPHHLLPANTELPAMVRWRQAYWEGTAVLMDENAWIIRVATPMKDSIDSLQADYIENFVIMLIVSVAGLLLVPIASRPLSTPLKRLTYATSMFISSTTRTDIEWPTSHITV